MPRMLRTLSELGPAGEDRIQQAWPGVPNPMPAPDPPRCLWWRGRSAAHLSKLYTGSIVSAMEVVINGSQHQREHRKRQGEKRENNRKIKKGLGEARVLVVVTVVDGWLVGFRCLVVGWSPLWCR